jgi:putative ABC transport system substrate-binding protein
MAMRTIGILHSGSQNKNKKMVDEFLDTLETLGFKTTGLHPNLTIASAGPLYADDDPATLATHAKTLAQTANLDVFVAAGGTRSLNAAITARQSFATPSLTIVFTSVSAPPPADEHLTGVNALTSELDGDRLAILYEFLGKPVNPSIGVIRNSNRPNASVEWATLTLAAAKLGVTLDPENVSFSANIKSGIDTAFANLKGRAAKAVLVTADPLFNNHRDDVISAANANTPIPTIYQWREFSDDKGLMSFGTKLTQSYRMAGGYVSFILQQKDLGTSPGIIKVDSPHVELVINKKTSDSSNFKIPPVLYARADDVIT